MKIVKHLYGLESRIVRFNKFLFSPFYFYLLIERLFYTKGGIGIDLPMHDHRC